MTFNEWFQSKQGEPYDSMYLFARDAWAAAREAAPLALHGPDAVLRFERSTAGKENEMPIVVSCNWLPDGEYKLYTEQQVRALGWLLLPDFLRRRMDLAAQSTGKRKPSIGLVSRIDCAWRPCAASLLTGSSHPCAGRRTEC